MSFVAESANFERIERAHLGAAQCRAAIAPVLEKRRVPTDEERLTTSERIYLRALARSRADRHRPA